MKLLELFCGTKSVGDVFAKEGHEIVSLDYDKKFNATHTEDIMEWDYKQYASDYFDVIWASPDCTTWSVAAQGKYRLKSCILGKDGEHIEKARFANRMIDRVLEILSYFKVSAWFMENPRGLLQYYPPLVAYMENHNRTLVYYGNYEWSSPKPTHLWSNLKMWDDEKKPDMRDKRVKHGIKTPYPEMSNRKSRGRSKIPPLLIKRLYDLIII